MKRKSSTAGKKRIVFEIDAPPGSRVSVAGDFNGWRAGDRPLKETESGHFSRAVYLEPGRVEYRYVINGQWVSDPACHASVPNGLGETNSVVIVS